ncbi:MAG: MoxR family ATPase [Pseudomonadota bacterium]
MTETTSNPLAALQRWLEGQIIGQTKLIDNLLISLLANGHLLVEGAPGLAKTRAIQKLSDVMEGEFQRIQFTPDLLPGDITGTDIFRPATGEFEFQSGPIFHNLILADEINRAPAKVQSALLEAMSEKQVSVGNTSYPLPDLFLVMATQNPLEQEGTYPLPEAQLDRFLMHVVVDYPSAEDELKILHLTRNEAGSDEQNEPNIQLTKEHIHLARQQCLQLHMSDAIEQYIVQLVAATRYPEKYPDAELKQFIEYGVSPRATIALDRCARAHAWLNGRDFVNPGDVQAVVYNVFRHRIIASYAAEAQGISKDQLIERIVKQVPVV